MNDELKPVYQNIDDSPYYLEIENFTFYFSSAFYQHNFKLKLPGYLREEEYKMRNRYKIINSEFFDLLKEVLMISLYKKIEKRGFKVFKDNKIYNESGD